jgi:hypothetical protein
MILIIANAPTPNETRASMALALTRWINFIKPPFG